MTLIDPSIESDATNTVTKVTVRIDGEDVSVDEGATILDACNAQGIDTPTICYAENLTPVNVCRVCVVEVEGNRTLVPSCSRPVLNVLIYVLQPCLHPALLYHVHKFQ